jgi:hypothetical protein
MPLQTSTDCGSETTLLYGLCNSLQCVHVLHMQWCEPDHNNKKALFPEYDLVELPAHVYICSIHNSSIERAWLRLRLDFGDNAVNFFNNGIESGMYNPDNPQH